jgi:NTE family protein
MVFCFGFCCRDFLSVDEVINNPTNFAAMSEAWIEALSNRGEQLTRVLVSVYLSELLS